MTQDGWREVIRNANSDADALELLAQLLAEQDTAKERLRRMGWGVIGTPWSEMIDQIELEERSKV